MTKLGLLLIILMQSSFALANTTKFFCTGTTTGQSGRQTQEFEISVSTTPPNIIGPGGPLALCALTLSEEAKNKLKTSCSATDQEVICQCSGGDFILASTHKISRSTGKLTFLSSTKDDVLRGNYSCTKITQKIF